MVFVYFRIERSPISPSNLRKCHHHDLALTKTRILLKYEFFKIEFVDLGLESTSGDPFETRCRCCWSHHRQAALASQFAAKNTGGKQSRRGPRILLFIHFCNYKSFTFKNGRNLVGSVILQFGYCNVANRTEGLPWEGQVSRNCLVHVMEQKNRNQDSYGVSWRWC